MSLLPFEAQFVQALLQELIFRTTPLLSFHYICPTVLLDICTLHDNHAWMLWTVWSHHRNNCITDNIDAIVLLIRLRIGMESDYDAADVSVRRVVCSNASPGRLAGTWVPPCPWRESLPCLGVGFPLPCWSLGRNFYSASPPIAVKFEDGKESRHARKTHVFPGKRSQPQRNVLPQGHRELQGQTIHKDMGGGHIQRLLPIDGHASYFAFTLACICS